MCHAPIVVPPVVGARGEACAQSTAAMRAAARRVHECKPDVVVVLSPHTRRPRRAFSIVGGDRVFGDFGGFGAPDVAVDLPAAVDARALIKQASAVEAAAPIEEIRAHALDHGALVPLWFLVEAGWRGPTVVIGLPAEGSRDANHEMGRALAAAAAANGERWAIVASGDCSHRLIAGAPAGFHPRAAQFDAALARAIASGDDEQVSVIDEELRDLAAEDVIDTVEIAAAATAFSANAREVLSYEGPYGVGYLVAVLHDESATSATSATSSDSVPGGDVLIDIARDALGAWHERRARKSFDTAMVDAQPSTGVFVTWRAVRKAIRDDDERTLRGCVGRMQLDCPVSKAVADLAVSAASADPRFPPIHANEHVVPEVTLLSPSEPVASVDELDPAIWGVEARLGYRHGVLLPDIDGVDDVATQVSIVLRKAGIGAHENYELRKFRARKVKAT